MAIFHSHGADFAYERLGISPSEGTVVFWAHGWGQNRQSFNDIISPLERSAHHITIDFPGFGSSPEPSDHWGTEDYADAIAAWLKQENIPPVFWVGHSFGCRVGLQMAARHPDRVKGLCLISGAGLKRKRPMWQKVYFYCRIRLFKILRHCLPTGSLKDLIMRFFGSADYNNSSGTLRRIFVRVVNEDLKDQAKKVTCPTLLIYGEDDTETPPEIGERLSQLIPDSKLFVLEGQDHYSILQSGRHQVVKLLNDVLKQDKNEKANSS